MSKVDETSIAGYFGLRREVATGRVRASSEAARRANTAQFSYLKSAIVFHAYDSNATIAMFHHLY